MCIYLYVYIVNSVGTSEQWRHGNTSQHVMHMCRMLKAMQMVIMRLMYTLKCCWTLIHVHMYTYQLMWSSLNKLCACELLLLRAPPFWEFVEPPSCVLQFLSSHVTNCIHTYTHTCVRACTHTHTHTHTHTRTQMQIFGHTCTHRLFMQCYVHVLVYLNYLRKDVVSMSLCALDVHVHMYMYMYMCMCTKRVCVDVVHVGAYINVHVHIRTCTCVYICMCI